MNNKEFQENFSEYMFYLSIILYDKYIKKYKYKTALYNFVRLTYNVILIF